MIDSDGIERPDQGDAHTINLPHIGTKKIKTKKNIRNTAWIYRFGCYVFRIVVYLILTPLNFIFFRLKTEGKENLKLIRKKGVVIVANHCHFMDVTFIAVKMMPRTFYTVSLPENFRIPVIGALVKALDALPIPTDLHGMRLFKEVVSDVLKEKTPVLFFSEGALWQHYRELRPFKEGAFRTAVQNNVPVMPAVTTFTVKHKSLTKKKYRTKLTFLKPIYPDASLPVSEAIEKLKKEVHQAMRLKIEACRKDIYTRSFRRRNYKLLEEKKLARMNGASKENEEEAA